MTRQMYVGLWVWLTLAPMVSLAADQAWPPASVLALRRRLQCAEPKSIALPARLRVLEFSQKRAQPLRSSSLRHPPVSVIPVTEVITLNIKRNEKTGSFGFYPTVAYCHIRKKMYASVLWVRDQMGDPLRMDDKILSINDWDLRNITLETVDNIDDAFISAEEKCEPMKVKVERKIPTKEKEGGE